MRFDTKFRLAATIPVLYAWAPISGTALGLASTLTPIHQPTGFILGFVAGTTAQIAIARAIQKATTH